MIFDEHIDIGIGIDDDWLVNTFNGERDNDLMDREEYMTQLKEELYEEFDNCKFSGAIIYIQQIFHQVD